MHHPHPPLRVVGVDPDPVGTGAVRPLAEVIPLGPPLLDLPIAVQGVDAVLPDPALGVPEHIDADGPGVAGELRGHGIRQPRLSALEDEDPVRRFGEDAGIAAEGVPRLGERHMPPGNHIVGAGADGAQVHLLGRERVPGGDKRG